MDAKAVNALVKKLEPKLSAEAHEYLSHHAERLTRTSKGGKGDG